MAVELDDSFALHPGPWLREQVLKPYGMTEAGAADHLQVTWLALSRVLNGKAHLTPFMAIRFEMAFGASAATLLRMQLSCDLAKAKVKASSISISRVPPPAQ